MDSRKQLLARLDLFTGLSEREIDEVAQIARRRTLKKGDVLFHKGDEGGDLYIIVSGVVKAYSTSPDGTEVVFRLMTAGEVTGDLAAFTGSPRTANNVAFEDCELLMIQRRELLPLLRRTPDIAIRLIAALAGRIAKLSEQFEDKNFRPVDERLAKLLLGFADRWGRPVKDGVQIDIRASQTELGEFVGATRESVNKIVGAWREEGVLEHQDHRVTIKRRKALEDVAERKLLKR